MQWNDEQFLLGVEEMDATHREFVALVNRLSEAKGAAFAVAFGELLVHTRDHFANEERLMEEVGFSAIHEHRGEHRRVIADLLRLHARILNGHQAMARAYLAEVPAWFRHHAATMDSALAASVKNAM